MKVWIVWASNGQAYEDNNQDIWAVCSSEEAAKQCIANAREQLCCDGEREGELQEIRDTRELTKDEHNELDRILERGYCIPWWGENNGLPYFSIREYETIN